ncbi:hypothetical protein QOT17_002823 [Balamuthia mandrillaris]
MLRTGGWWLIPVIIFASTVWLLHTFAVSSGCDYSSTCILTGTIIIPTPPASVPAYSAPSSTLSAPYNQLPNLVPPSSSTTVRRASPSSSAGDVVPFNVWLFMMIPLSRSVMLPYFLQHYLHTLSLKPQNTYFILHVREEEQQSEELASTSNLLRGYGVSFQVWNGEYTSHQKGRLMTSLKASLDIKDNDWIIQADSDELQQWKTIDASFVSVPQFLQKVVQSEQNYTHIPGWMIDRLTEDGSLRDPQPLLLSPQQLLQQQPRFLPLEEQYPLSCAVTKNIAQGMTGKVVAHLARYPIASGGAHMMKDQKTSSELKPWPRRVPVHHYKFGADMPSMLEERLRLYKSKGFKWFAESERILSHLQEHGGRFCVSCPELECTK